MRSIEWKGFGAAVLVLAVAGLEGCARRGGW